MAKPVQLGRCHFSFQQLFLVQAEQITPSIVRSSFCSAASSSLVVRDGGEESRKESGKWLTLPPFAPQKDVSSFAKELAGGKPSVKEEPTTALKWVRRCCPHLPISLVQKLFRLRQVRKELVSASNAGSETQSEQQQLKRVSAKEVMSSREVILLPVTVQNSTTGNAEQPNNHNEIKFIRSLILYKDSAIIVINKPHGLPVQGGIGIKNSVDVLAATALKFDSSESPKLVHRLDRECSGLLILGRTQISSSVLHSIFRQKTCGVLKDSVKNAPRVLRRKYWALVIGSPRNSSGLISAPIGKVITEDEKSERITIIKDDKPTFSQHALTEYKVIRTSTHGLTWLELCPLTGRKHQLRVHCAEVLRTPIVGDYKYGWHANRKWKSIATNDGVVPPKEKLPFGLNFEGGSISEKQPRMHLHCRQVILPNITEAVRCLEATSVLAHELSELELLDLVAPLPTHMQLSWNILNF